MPYYRIVCDNSAVHSQLLTELVQTNVHCIDVRDREGTTYCLVDADLCPADLLVLILKFDLNHNKNFTLYPRSTIYSTAYRPTSRLTDIEYNCPASQLTELVNQSTTL